MSKIDIVKLSRLETVHYASKKCGMPLNTLRDIGNIMRKIILEYRAIIYIYIYISQYFILSSLF